MKKTELIERLQQKFQQWEAFLDQIGPAHMDQPGVVAHWTMKDLVAHLTGWNRKLVASMQAAQGSEPAPPPPWPVHLQDMDEINAWLYETNRERALHDILKESRQVFQQLITVIENLPDDVQIEIVQTESGQEFNVVTLGGERFLASEFFDHYRDDHEADVRAWLAQIQEQ